MNRSRAATRQKRLLKGGLGTFVCGRCEKEHPKTGTRQVVCPACAKECKKVRDVAYKHGIKAGITETVGKAKSTRSPAKTNCRHYDDCLDEAARMGRPNIKCPNCKKFEPNLIKREASIPCSLWAEGFYAFGESGVPVQCEW